MNTIGNPIPLYDSVTSSSYIGGKTLLHKVTPHKFGGMMMSASFVLVIGIDVDQQSNKSIVNNKLKKYL
jgi:hypothetical protein